MIWIVLAAALTLFLLFELDYIVKTKAWAAELSAKLTALLTDNTLWIMALAFIFILEMYWAFTIT